MTDQSNRIDQSFKEISGMNEPGDDKNNLDKIAETLARESDISKDRRVKFTRKTKKNHWKPKEKKTTNQY